MRRNAVLTAALLAVCAVAACDVPTEAPILEQRWMLPLEGTTLGVDELLPAGVSVVGDAFSVSVDPFSTAQSLGTLCPGCAPFNGSNAPVPAFSGTFDASQSLPADVTSAAIQSGSIDITIQNGFSFDPLAGGGTITVTLHDGPGGPQLGQVTFTGALPAMGSATRTMTLAAATVGATLFATVDVDSPGGQTTTIDTSQELSVTATVTSLLVSSATVSVNNRTVDLDPVSLDVDDVDSAVTDRLQSGALTLEVTNPFGVAVSGTLRIGPTTKSFSLPADPQSTITISYTGDELRSFLGTPGVTFTGSGTVQGGSVTVTPDQTMRLDPTLDITLRIG